MDKDFFGELESAPVGSCRDLSAVMAALRWDQHGLLPVVTQCADSGAVLMLAWMNAEALRQTLQSGRMVYYSRRRQALWEKGATSGNRQWLVTLAADCDGDALLAKVRQEGPACHTGRPSCFYARLDSNGLEIIAAPVGNK